MRFLVFAGYARHPLGGWYDFIKAFDRLDQAREFVKTLRCDWTHIVDIDKLAEIERTP